MLLMWCQISMSHGNHYARAKLFYEECQYHQAIEYCQKEARTWYNLLDYNFNERTAMYMMAEAYCQLEDFENARNVYKLMIDRYHGEFYGQRAQEDLNKLEKGLETVSYYPDRILESPLPDYLQRLNYTPKPKHIFPTYFFHSFSINM